MLEKYDLTSKMDKRTYKKIMPILAERLYMVQKASWNSGIPVVILFEGWDASGKGVSIKSLTAPLDPRGFKLYPIRTARSYEKKHPWLWRFWIKLPVRGEWAIFDQSWYGRVLKERVENLIPEADWRRGFRDILDFERTIADDGTVIIKFFLHISKQDQKRRFEKLIKDPQTAWHVAPEDWEHHRQYDKWLMAYEEMFEQTEAEWGPWTVVEANDRRHAQAKIYQTIISVLEERLGLEPIELLLTEEPTEENQFSGESITDENQIEEQGATQELVEEDAKETALVETLSIEPITASVITEIEAKVPDRKNTKKNKKKSNINDYGETKT